jgi:hypothetical protein
MTMHMTMTEHVRYLKTTDGEFPAIFKQKFGDTSEFYDLSKIPPTLHRLTDRQIIANNRDLKWQHPPAGASYNAQELADIIAFLRWATTGAVKDVAASEVQ